jgi:4-diphosphocytidyl-2-C-methyl-D-erythritol kinase
LHALAASLGSDVPFFLSGGVALASGRGECLTPLSPPAALFAVVVAPTIEIPAKTRTLYGSLTSEDYSDGSRTERSARLGESGWISNAELLGNAFARPLYDLVPGLKELPALMRRHGATVVGLSGAGPAHYSLETDPARARDLQARLQEELQNGADVVVDRILDHGVLVAKHATVPESHEWFAQMDDN